MPREYGTSVNNESLDFGIGVGVGGVNISLEGDELGIGGNIGPIGGSVFFDLEEQQAIGGAIEVGVQDAISVEIGQKGCSQFITFNLQDPSGTIGTSWTIERTLQECESKKENNNNGDREKEEGSNIGNQSYENQKEQESRPPSPPIPNENYEGKWITLYISYDEYRSYNRARPTWSNGCWNTTYYHRQRHFWQIKVFSYAGKVEFIDSRTGPNRIHFTRGWGIWGKAYQVQWHYRFTIESDQGITFDNEGIPASFIPPWGKDSGILGLHGKNRWPWIKTRSALFGDTRRLLESVNNQGYEAYFFEVKVASHNAPEEQRLPYYCLLYTSPSPRDA